MKKIISGVGSDIIVKELERAGYIVSNDIPYQEGVLLTLKNEMADVLIISISIEGELSDFEFIRSIRNIDSKIKIILTDILINFFKKTPLFRMIQYIHRAVRIIHI